MDKTSILITKPSEGYELIDSGEGEKLERFGEFVLSRPDPQALWNKNNPEIWNKADAVFKRSERDGKWDLRKGLPEKWKIDFGGLGFYIKPTAFKHTGLFPEQLANWQWMRDRLVVSSERGRSEFSKARSLSERSLPSAGVASSAGLEETAVLPLSQSASQPAFSPEVLNLFGYTGGASLACAKAGAKVVHVDGSKSAINWARENAELSGLSNSPIRWILDDARVFVEREIKRGRKYDGIIMDPPAFGHGPKKELWKIEEDFLKLLENCLKILSDKPLFFIINGYSAGYSSIAYRNSLLKIKDKFGGSIEIGELAIEEKGKSRLLPAGIFARWSMGN